MSLQFQYKLWRSGDTTARDRGWEVTKMCSLLTLHLMVSIFYQA